MCVSWYSPSRSARRRATWTWASRSSGRRSRTSNGSRPWVALGGVEVGEVEQQHRGGFEHLSEERSLAEFRVGPLDKGGDCSSARGDREFGFDEADVLHEDLERLVGSGHGQQVTGFEPSPTDEGDVLADQRRVKALGEHPQVGDPLTVRLLGPAKRELTPWGMPHHAGAAGQAAANPPQERSRRSPPRRRDHNAAP